MDEIITEVKKVEREYRMGDKEIKAICYADDVVLISESEDNLQRLLYKFEKNCVSFQHADIVDKQNAMPNYS